MVGEWITEINQLFDMRVQETTPKVTVLWQKYRDVWPQTPQYNRE